jgi:hypothetical protein
MTEEGSAETLVPLYRTMTHHIPGDSNVHNYLLNIKFWEELIAYLSWYDTGHIENDASNNYSSVACVFVAAVTFLPSRCLASIKYFYRPVA